jgi:chitin synthase
VAPDSIPHMVYSMEEDKKILACCGETQVDNKSQSWVTMIQVFEYYSNHHMKKAFESVFGCVTCLPGCFTMYRIFAEDKTPLVTSDAILLNYARNDIESLHEKNLFHLGEDRMLTTLLLRYFPGMRLSFVPEAECWTIVPHTFSILLSQRRRWINSTFHNMWELLKVETMCGVCCVSMKMVVICDMIATMILPASLLYAGYFVYLAVTDSQNIDQVVVILYGIMLGVQMLTFVIRARWDYLWWFAIFAVMGVPVFYFLLPIYSFWHMDDFSWGQTRQVNTTIIDDEEANDSIEEEQLFEVSLKSNPGPVSDSGSSLSREDDVALPVSSPLNPIFLLI